MNKKYLPSALIMYLNYFIHGVGCSILGQAVIKEALAAAWGVEAMAITAISAALGLGRLIALPFAGPLSDKLGRRHLNRDRQRLLRGLPDWTCFRIQRRTKRRLSNRLCMCNHRRYLQLVP